MTDRRRDGTGTGDAAMQTPLRTQKITLRLSATEWGALQQRAAAAGYREIAVYVRDWVIAQEPPKALLCPAENLDLFDLLNEQAVWARQATVQLQALCERLSDGGLAIPDADEESLDRLWGALQGTLALFPAHLQGINALQSALMRPVTGLDQIRGMLAEVLAAVRGGPGGAEERAGGGHP